KLNNAIFSEENSLISSKIFFIFFTQLAVVQIVSDGTLSVSTLWIALLHVRYSLIPDGTGIRQPSTARHCDPGLRAPLAC
ncbi:hypothetical protein ACVWPW_30360, partial [Citrobacter freundii complex sp. 2025EL-00205]